MSIQLTIEGSKAIKKKGTWLYQGVGTTPDPQYFTADSDYHHLILELDFNRVDTSGDKSALLSTIQVGDTLILKGLGGSPEFKVLAVSSDVNQYYISVENTVNGGQLIEGGNYSMSAGLIEGYLEAELYPDEGVVLKRQILTETGLDNSNRQFTRDFNIPATPTNNELLNHWELKSNESIVNPNKAIRARIGIGDLITWNGSIELLSVTWKNRKPESYKIVFYGDTSGLKALFGDDLLSDVDWTPYEFEWSQANVVASWEPLNTNYHVPVIAWKRWYKWYETRVSPPNNDPDDISVEETGVLLSELRVGLRLPDMIKSLGDHVGQTFIFDPKLESFLTESFIIPSRFEDQAFTFSSAFFETRVHNSTPIGTVITRTILVLDVIDSDPSNRWDGTSTYTAEFSGVYQFDLPFVIPGGGGGPKTDFDCYLYEDGIEVQADAISTNSGGTFQFTHTCAENKLYTFYISSDGDSTINIEMYTAQVPVSIIGTTYDPADNMPRMKIVDFIGGFIKAFNVLVYESGLNEFTFTDTATLYVTTGQPIDLEDYVNEQSLIYEKVNVFNQINFRHKVGKDAPNVFFYDYTGRYYAEVDFLPDVDFSKGLLDHESIFTVFPPTYMDIYDSEGSIGNTDLWCHYQLSNDDPPKPVLADFLLMYRNGSETTNYPWYLQLDNDITGAPTFSEQLTWGRYSQVQQVPSLSTSNTLSYSLENAFIGTQAGNTITNVFWNDWLIQLYKRTAYTLTLKFPANFGIYIKLTSVRLIYLNGFYHFLAAWEYNSATNMLTIDLLRADKSLLIETVETNGQLLINNL